MYFNTEKWPKERLKLYYLFIIYNRINWCVFYRIELNNEALRRFGGPDTLQRDYYSVDRIIQERDNDEDQEEFVPLEFIHNLNPSGMPQHILSLKIGCQVMLLRNLNIDLGLVNGTRMVVRDLGWFMRKCRSIKNNFSIVLWLALT